MSEPDTDLRAAFIDIDGTLLDASQHVPTSAEEACHAAVSAGHLLFLCTGRSLPEIYPWLWDLGFSGIVASGGGYARLGEDVLLDQRITGDVLRETSDQFDAWGAEFVWQGPDALYPSAGFFDNFAQRHARMGDWSAYTARILPFVRRSLPTSTSKCTFVLPPDSPIGIEGVSERFRGVFHVIPGSFSPGTGIAGEMVPEGVSKAVGLHTIVEALTRRGTPVVSVAIGDSANDREMIDEADLGIAMGNGRDAVKRIADWVSAPLDRDGLALAFAHAGLI